MMTVTIGILSVMYEVCFQKQYEFDKKHVLIRASKVFMLLGFKSHTLVILNRSEKRAVQ